MDSCNSWSPKNLSPEALPPLDLILPTMAEEPVRRFCSEGEDDGDGFSSCLSNETFPHLETTTISSSFFPATSSVLGVSPQSRNLQNHDQPTGSAKAVQEETFSLPSPTESTDCCTEAVAKRVKLDEYGAAFKAQSSQSHVPKLGEKITALQQLVAPFGKTDTASVLLEAIGYIKFLQDQVNVLSSPYMTASATTSKEVMDLRSRGLCLVPISCTVNVATNSNGADYWISGISGCSR